MKRSATYVVVAGIVAVGFISACGTKGTERFQDAPVDTRNTNGATVGTMPDGFSNWAAKCDGPNMVYVLFHGDSPYGSIAVVKDDSRCVK